MRPVLPPRSSALICAHLRPLRTMPEAGGTRISGNPQPTRPFPAGLPGTIVTPMSDTAKVYVELRAAGREVHRKVMDACQSLDFDFIRIAKTMTLPVMRRTLVFDGDVDQYAFFDFTLHEYRVGGKSMMESCDAISAGLTDLEEEIRQAHCVAPTSLFEIGSGVPQDHQLGFRDLLRRS